MGKHRKTNEQREEEARRAGEEFDAQWQYHYDRTLPAQEAGDIPYDLDAKIRKDRREDER